MKIDLWTALIAGMFGILTASVVPFAKWQVDKFKLRREEKKFLIKQLREVISSDKFNTQVFKNTVLYSRFREHLPDEITERIDCKDGKIRLELHLAESRDGIKNELLDQLCILEKKWKLI
jgi:hypothetical protein